jgi:hypothetical protein
LDFFPQAFEQGLQESLGWFAAEYLSNHKQGKTI